MGSRTLGVIYDPLRNEIFYAIKGQGAWLNGAPMRVADTDSLSAALFGTGIPFGSMNYIDDHAADIARLAPHCAGVRRMGAAALDLAYVACGRLERVLGAPLAALGHCRRAGPAARSRGRGGRADARCEARNQRHRVDSNALCFCAIRAGSARRVRN